MLRLRAAWPRQRGVRLFSQTAAARDFGEEASYTRLAADRMRVIERRRVPGQRFAFDRDSTPRLPAVFYDGGCPLCVREISHYQRLDRDGAVAWVDLEGDDFSALEERCGRHTPRRAACATPLTRFATPNRYPRGVTKQEALRRFHVISPNGDMLVGAPAFVERTYARTPAPSAAPCSRPPAPPVWRHIPYWRHVVPLTRLPGVMAAMGTAYEWFAARRLQMTGRGSCESGSCSLPRANPK